jgi:hypothetical protein
MSRTTFRKRTSIRLAAAGLAAVGIIAAAAADGPAKGATANLRPICNGVFFNMPAQVGDTVTFSVRPYAADPDLTPVTLVSAFNAGAPIGTVRIAGQHELEFTLTSSTRGTVYLYWTVSDGSLTAQCVSTGSNEEPPDNG